MEKSKRKTTDAVEILDRRYGGDPEWDQMVLEEEIKTRVGQVVYALRSEAGLTQTRLASKTKLTQAMISKVEHGDYDGDYFNVLLKVCFVLHKKVDVGGPGVPLIDGAECCAVIST
jgi:DNA-binding XRE family transcriptional regulator